MVDDVRVQTPPNQIVWLSSNCCDLTPAAPPRPPQVHIQAQVPDRDAGKPATRLPRLMALLKRKPRREASRAAVGKPAA
jgi:hypothetical protein